MKSKRHLISILIVILSGFIFSFISWTSGDPVWAAARISPSSPMSELCLPLLQQESAEFSFDIQTNGSWQGLQRVAKADSLQKRGEITGSSLADLRYFLLESPCGIGNLGGTMTLEISGRVQVGQTFNLVLPSNPSTGYLWEMEGMERNTTIVSGETQMRQVIPRIGGMAAQIIPFHALRSSVTTIRLRYHRPWETDVPIGIAYKVKGENTSLADLARDLSLTIPTAEADDPNSHRAFPLASTPTPNDIASAQELPTSFNWCSQGECTAVRNQGNCGSCWAFSTVGVLESKLLIADNNNQNLSEQYLVSCNTDGWGCDGGWFAHDYHIWKTPPSENQAGAVLESAFPYQAREVPCNGPYSHSYRALSWHYVSRYNDIPSVGAIKEAIYTHGPVAAAVCAGPAFDSYHSGIFSTDEWSVCGSSLVNHGIVLVGWDDSQGVWILRNSWGASWGEGGYMRIRYGTSNVGLGANYLVYDSAPNPTTSPSPSPPPTTVVPPSNAASLYLPLILRLTPSATLLPNGDFEQGRTTWQEYSKQGYELIYNINQTTNAAPPHGGQWAAWLGGAYNEISFVQQTVTIPIDKPILSYWHWIDSADECGYDFGGVLVKGSVVDVYSLCADQDTQGWVLHTVDLSDYKGQTVVLQIRAETDNLYNSNLFIDDVGFQTTLATGLPSEDQNFQLHSVAKTANQLQSSPKTTPIPLERVFPSPSFLPRRGP